MQDIRVHVRVRGCVRVRVRVLAERRWRLRLSGDDVRIQDSELRNKLVTGIVSHRRYAPVACHHAHFSGKFTHLSTITRIYRVSSRTCYLSSHVCQSHAVHKLFVLQWS